MPTHCPAARLVAGILSAAGGGLILGGIAGVGVAIIQGHAGASAYPEQMGMMPFTGIVIVGASVVALLLGLIILSNAQSMRTNIDTADYSREMLALMRESFAKRGRRRCPKNYLPHSDKL